MSVSDTCSCRGQKRSIVGHCHCFVQDYVANEWWPADKEWRRYRSAHNELESSSEVADQDEALRSVNSDDEDRELDFGWDGIRHSRRDFIPHSRRDGIRQSRRGGRQDGGRDGGLVGGWYGRRNSTRDGALVGGRVSGWDGAPRSSYRGTSVKLIFYWEKCCQRCNVPDAVDDGYFTEQAVHHNHHGYVDDNSGSVGRGERSHDRGRMVLSTHRRKTPSSRRQRPPHFVHGTDWF